MLILIEVEVLNTYQYLSANCSRAYLIANEDLESVHLIGCQGRILLTDWPKIPDYITLRL